ncbi:hypothetical protein MNBD_NITROSPINAE02-440 [hydrothermal vent metagenome]|uniref:HPt domain-containing protein n=1 Tax=hydrothermal vent metagenome TaxID=652676 RepID=A0A3B1CPK4_9ZZZZ
MENGKLIIEIDEEMADLIPEYLEGREKDLTDLRAALEQGDYGQIARIGHSLKGSGGGYGFDLLSEIGAELENTARQTNKESAPRWINYQLVLLADYLERIEVKYVEINDE